MISYQEILKQYWGYDDFRGIQREIIESIGSGHDTLGLMPTGGGKSITFQVPALCQDGTCIVITPLIALMKDQVDHLRRRGIRAAAIYSGLTREEIIITLENCIFGDSHLQRPFASGNPDRSRQLHLRRSEDSLCLARTTLLRNLPNETASHESELHHRR